VLQLDVSIASWDTSNGNVKQQERCATNTIGDALSVWWMWVLPVAFVAVLVYVLNPQRKNQFQRDARIPLEDDSLSPNKK
jgi:cbb3-type cytochrome oxidase subunit 3